MLTINSKDRVSTSSSSANFILKKSTSSSIRGFRIEYMQLPYSWYTITSSNNSIRINGASTVSITAGSYSASTLARALQTALQVVDATFTCVFSTITNKFTIARSTNFTMNLSSSLFTMRRQLGFNATSDTAAALTVTSDSVVNIHNGNSISLHSDVLSKALRNHVTDSRSEYVTSIPINVNPGDIIYFQPGVDVVYKFADPISLSQEFTVQLKDIDGNVISLNGCEWEMKIIYF